MNTSSSSLTRSLVLIVVVLIAGALFLATPGEVSANTCISNGVNDGIWNDPTAWFGCGGVIPTINDDVVINTSNKVSVNIATAVAKSVTVKGTLTIGRTAGTSTKLTIATGLTIISGATVNTIATDSHQLVVYSIVNNGTFIAPKSIEIGGSWSDPGTFTHNSGTVTITASYSSLADQFSFYNLVISWI